MAAGGKSLTVHVMEPRQQRLLRAALEHGSKKRHEDKGPDATLRDKSLEHTDPDYVPRTLTPHEWQAWYAQHGVPPGHRPAAQREQDGASGLTQWLRRIFGGPGGRHH